MSRNKSAPADKNSWLARRAWGLEGGIFVGGVEARTTLAGVEDIVADDEGLGEAGVQPLQQPKHGRLLRLRARIGGNPLGIQAPLITDPDAVSVVPHAVGSNLLEPAPRLDGAVAPDHKVVAAPFPSLPAVPVVDVAHTALLRWSHSRAVNNDQRDGTHGSHQLGYARGGTECRQNSSEDTDERLDDEFPDGLLRSDLRDALGSFGSLGSFGELRILIAHGGILLSGYKYPNDPLDQLLK